jgi:glycogen debranching enzyme
VAHRVNLRARGDHLFTYSGRSVLVADLAGRIPRQDPIGLYVDNTRFLSALEVTADGRQPSTISASPVGGDGFLSYAELQETDLVPKASAYLETTHFVGEGMRTILRVTSFAPRALSLELAIHPEADFADSEEADHGERQQTADTEAAWDEAISELRIRYCHPRLDRRTVIRVERSPAPARWNGHALLFTLELPARGSAEIELATEPVFDGDRVAATPRRSFAQAAAPLEHLRAELAAEMPRLTSSNATVSKAWETAVRDLASLPYGLADGPATPIAGLPLYLQFFGRDSLTIGWQALVANTSILRDSLRANAAWQGTRIDDWLDEEPGKMIHQARNGPLSVLGINPHLRYYGDWATPPDFLVMLGQYLAWTDDRTTVRSLLPAARAAIDWGFRYGDPDKDGFLEYDTRSSKGVKNQGWKDSHDAVVDERGRIVPNPIASSELQAYWYAALQQAAVTFGLMGDAAYAAELLGKALALKREFNRVFWMPDLGAYALGLGPDKQQIRSIGSNDGHLMAAGIVPVRRGRRLAKRLTEPDMFSGWGIRTLSSEHPAYNPFSYHRGSVWPVEQGTIAFGFARYGCWDELHRLAAGVFDTTDLFVENRLPEVISGISRDDAHPHPGIYPRSMEPQGWSASAIIQVVQSLLGMVAWAPMGLLIVDPHLPEWLPDLRLDGLRVGEARLDIEFRRMGSGATTWRVHNREGWVRVLRQAPPEAPGSGPMGRLLAALGSLGRS